MQVVYVLGFMFSADRRHVALIWKQKPKWQAGKLNGIGGRVEDTDKSAHAAMVREFLEEAGVSTDEGEWVRFCTMDDGPLIHCFVAITDKVYGVYSKTNEVVGIHPQDQVRTHPRISNLDWLIPMALDAMDKVFTGSVRYINAERS